MGKKLKIMAPFYRPDPGLVTRRSCYVTYYLKFMTGKISLTITIFSHVINFEFLHKFPRSVFYAPIDEGLEEVLKLN
jgi:hypothetical protein